MVVWRKFSRFVVLWAPGNKLATDIYIYKYVQFVCLDVLCGLVFNSFVRQVFHAGFRFWFRRQDFFTGLLAHVEACRGGCFSSGT